MIRRSVYLMGAFLLLTLFLGACRPVDPSLELGSEASSDLVPAGGQVGTDPTFPAPAEEAASAPDATLPPFKLGILHTNDTWGYHDPCG